MRLLLTDLGASLSLLSRLPVPVDHAHAGRRGAHAAWAWPVVGALLAALAALPGLALSALGVAAPIAAGASLAALIALSGAMHEDGLADTADGLWGGWETARRLDIMKDSRVGVYGVLALIMVTGLRWLALAALIEAGPLAFAGGMIAAAALSRAGMAAVMHALPNARESGLSAAVGALPRATMLRAVALGAGLSLASGGAAAGALAAAVLATAAVALVARAKIGGQTGDILGATQQCAECAALIAIATILS